jgi:hypothetical protein
MFADQKDMQVGFNDESQYGSYVLDRRIIEFGRTRKYSMAGELVEC